MAKSIPEVKIGNEVYQIKDRTAREHLVEVSETQPESEDNKLWIKNQEAEYEVPTLDEFNELKSAMDDITGNQSLPITGHGAYIDLTSQSPGIDNPVTSATAKYIVAPCAAGDQFVVSTVGGGLARAYGFFGSNKTTLISNSAVDLTCINTLVTAPANAAYFVANAVTNNDLRVIKNKLLVDKVSDLVSERQYNSYNILPAFGQFTSKTHNNITFTWQPDRIKCIVSSTNAASDTAYTTIYYSQTVLPAELIPGKSYYFEIERTDSSIVICTKFFLSGGTQTDYVYYKSNGYITIPSNAVGAMIRIQVASGKTANGYITITMNNAPSNKTVGELIETLKYIKPTDIVLTSSNYLTYFPNGSFNDAPDNSIYGISYNVPLTDGPDGDDWYGPTWKQPLHYDIRGTLVTLTQATSNQVVSGKTQILVGYRTSPKSPSLSYRTAISNEQGGFTWSAWSKFQQDGFVKAGNFAVFGGNLSETIHDMDNAPINSIFQIDLNLDEHNEDYTLYHNPAPGVSSVAVTFAFSYTTPHGQVQMVFTIDGRCYWRYGYINDQPGVMVWTRWFYIRNDTDGKIMRVVGRLSNNTDLNDLKTNGIYLMGGMPTAGYVHSPLTSGAGFITSKIVNDIVMHTVESLLGARYTRYSEDGGTTWSEWV